MPKSLVVNAADVSRTDNRAIIVPLCINWFTGATKRSQRVDLFFCHDWAVRQQPVVVQFGPGRDIAVRPHELTGPVHIDGVKWITGHGGNQKVVPLVHSNAPKVLPAHGDDPKLLPDATLHGRKVLNSVVKILSIICFMCLLFYMWVSTAGILGTTGHTTTEVFPTVSGEHEVVNEFHLDSTMIEAVGRYDAAIRPVEFSHDKNRTEETWWADDVVAQLVSSTDWLVDHVTDTLVPGSVQFENDTGRFQFKTLVTPPQPVIANDTLGRAIANLKTNAEDVRARHQKLKNRAQEVVPHLSEGIRYIACENYNEMIHHGWDREASGWEPNQDIAAMLWGCDKIIAGPWEVLDELVTNQFSRTFDPIAQSWPKFYADAEEELGMFWESLLRTQLAIDPVVDLIFDAAVHKSPADIPLDDALRNSWYLRDFVGPRISRVRKAAKMAANNVVAVRTVVLNMADHTRMAATDPTWELPEYEVIEPKIAPDTQVVNGRKSGRGASEVWKLLDQIGIAIHDYCEAISRDLQSGSPESSADVFGICS